MQNSRTLATWEFFGKPAGLLIFLPFYCTPMEDAPPDGPRMSSASCCSLLGLVPSPLAPSSQQLLEFPGHVRCLAFDARHLLPPLECLNLPDTGIQFSANAQFREAVQRRLAGGSRLQRKNDVMEISLLAGRPSNVLNFQLDKQLLQYLDKREKQQLRMAFSQAYSL